MILLEEVTTNRKKAGPSPQPPSSAWTASLEACLFFFFFLKTYHNFKPVPGILACKFHILAAVSAGFGHSLSVWHP